MRPLLALAASLFGYFPLSAQSFTLYTPFTKVSVPPGESLDYTIELINNGSSVRTADIVISGMPKGWTYEMKSGGWNVSQMQVLPKEKKTFNLHVQVPLKVNKGTYSFAVVAQGLYRLPLTVIVSEQGTFKTEFTTDQVNMEGAANSTFTFNAKLRNRTADNQVYALRAAAPPGWGVAFKANYKQVSSVAIDANRTQDITIEVDPPDHAKAGTYKIPIVASTSSTSADVELEVVITGTYGLEFTTPDGLLSTDITAGDDSRVALVVKNTGSAELKNITFGHSAPRQWTVSYEPDKVEKLAPGETAEIHALIKPDRKAVAGDYVANLEARTAETSSKVTYRITVKAPLLWGWLGVLIILAAVGSVYYLFRNYGRR